MNRRHPSRSSAGRRFQCAGRVLACLGWLCAHPASAQSTVINAGLTGSWSDPGTPGQGFFIDVDPEQHIVFLAWFTWGAPRPEQTALIGPSTHRWYVAVGGFSEGDAGIELTLSETEGGAFDRPSEFGDRVIGNITLTFTSCTEAVADFRFDEPSRSGRIDLARLGDDVHCTLTEAR